MFLLVAVWPSGLVIARALQGVGDVVTGWEIIGSTYRIRPAPGAGADPVVVLVGRFAWQRVGRHDLAECIQDDQRAGLPVRRP
jgi:hypothetical protein